MAEEQPMLFNTETAVHCERCGARCKVSGTGNSKAKMLRRSAEPKGLCVNCAVHDFLRNTYPVNMLLAKSGPQSLAYPHIQEQFTAIMRVGLADAQPDEIKWDLIIKNWDLPFPNKVKPSAVNPCNQKELDEIASGKRPDFCTSPCRHPVRPEDLTITSFEQLNELKPGLGDKLKRCLRNVEQ